MPTLRAMVEADVPVASEVWQASYGAMARRYGLEAPVASEVTDRRLEDRLGHFLGTDPGGSFVAEVDGRVVAFAQSFVREGYWVLSLLATLPGHQGHGLGRRLLDAALANGGMGSPGTIQASRDPSAVALYSSAGFSCHPAMKAEGVIRRPTTPDPQVRAGGAGDVALVDAVDRERRGAARGVDIEHMLRVAGNRLLLIGDRGYAIARDDRLITLGARDVGAAAALLQTVLAQIPAGGTVEVGWLTSAQQWAIDAVVGAGIDLHPYGAVMVRGMDGPPAPCIPSGGYG